MTIVAASVPEGAAPRLLLDTNIYLDLADGLLSVQESRLIAVAAHRTPPLFWACEIVFDELVYRIRGDDSSEFLRVREALRWMERLCGGRGMAEDKKWAVRRGVYTDATPCDPTLANVLVHVRREILRARTIDQLSPDLLEKIDGLRALYREDIDRWVLQRTEIGDAVRAKLDAQTENPGPDNDLGPEEEPSLDEPQTVADALVQVSRKHVLALTPSTDGVRTEEDQKRAQREFIAFETWYLRVARNPDPYNHAKHRSDYNDYWLCAYPAAGYTLVTKDGRLREALKAGGCDDPRFVSLDEGLSLAEAWLSSQ